MAEMAPITATLLRHAPSGTRSSSRITIDTAGHLQQEIRTFNSPTGDTDLVRKAAAQIGAEAVVGILSLAELIVFWNYKDAYPRDDGTRIYEISLCLGKKSKTVRVHDLEEAKSSNVELFAFLQLWERIHRHAPIAVLPR